LLLVAHHLEVEVYKALKKGAAQAKERANRKGTAIPHSGGGALPPLARAAKSEAGEEASAPRNCLTFLDYSARMK